ncbi:hypothetical protein QYE76_025412 [Lolium multiflorum]|uniref:Uncharacterized protein n=1 Tax=Lolium multiflorum TaxID=4521 RepID=A0AAD8VWN6_LOLMU|nr:hypothetical protein QYE76_025412 [Lolium multiflorum]
MTTTTTTRPAAPTTEEEEAVVAAAAPVDAAPPGDADGSEKQKKARARSKKKKKRRRTPSEEEVAALRSVLRWARRGEAGDDEEAVGDCAHLSQFGRRRPRVAVELHAHSARSDGSLSPAALVQRAHRNGVS